MTKASSEKMDALCAERLRELLSYEPETGVFRWLRPPSFRVRIGGVAGTEDHKGYIRIRIDGRNYLAHRLAWLHTHGCWPTKFIDHINRARDDNRIANLREANRSQNQHNSKVGKHSKSGIKGVFWDSRRKAWLAHIYSEGRRRHLGAFPDPQSAQQAYAAAALRERGEFARVS